MQRNTLRIALAASLFLATVVAGFLLSSHFGPDLVRREVEKQLTRVLRGPVAIEAARLVVSDGLWLRGRRVSAYPAESGAHAGLPVLTAERVAARIDVVALVTGRLRLRTLEIEGLHLRLERFADGHWSLPPLEAVLRRRLPAEPGDLEKHLSLLKATEAITRTLLTRPLAANRVQLHYASVTFTDHRAAVPGEEPVTLRLRGIEGRLEHNWLAREAELSLRGQLTDSIGRRSDIEVSGRRRDGQSLTLAATDLPLSLLAPYLASVGPDAAADGTVSGVVAYRTPVAQHGVVELDWRFRNLDVSVPLRAEPLHIESPRLHLQSRIEIHPGRLRLAELELEGLAGAARLTASGVVERPLRESARAKLTTSVHGTGLVELRRIVSWLPMGDADPLTELLERLESGRIELIQASGGAPVSQWRRLVQGDLASLPTGFVLATEVANITVASEGPAALTDLEAHAEWSGDRIQLRRFKANWKGAPLPRLDASIDGLSHLLRGSATTRELKPGAEPLPGLGTLWSVLTSGEPAGRKDRATPLPEVQLAIEVLDHPALRWPVRNAKLQIAPTPGGVEIEASEGTWAGMPFQAKAEWLRNPEPHWKLAISVSEASTQNESQSAAGSASASHASSSESPASLARPSSTAWFRGQIGVASLESAGLNLADLQARFAFEGAELRLSNVTAQLTPQGDLSGKLIVDLSTSARLAVALDAELVAGDLAQLAPLMGLEPHQWSGEVSFKTGLEGWIDPERPLLAELSGSTFVLARNGELRRELPLVLALAQATEGFNPFASGGVARYDSVEMTLHLDRGRLSTDDLELDGPVRVYAEGFVDVARPNPEVSAVVGVFLFRQADRALGKVPLLSHLISDQGLVGGYFELSGSAQDPEVRGLPLNSLAAAIPDIVKAPFRAIRGLTRLMTGKQDPEPPAKRDSNWPDTADAWHQKIGHKP